MADEKHLQCIQQGVETWNAWRDQNPEVTPDLSQADLRGQKLQKANLKNARLKGARLQFSNLNGADLEAAQLDKAKLQEANLQSANLKDASLKGAGLLESNLQMADLCNADLTGAQFNEDVLFTQTNLKGANLSQATGLSLDQIQSALTDDKTRLPDYLEEEQDDDFLLQF